MKTLRTVTLTLLLFSCFIIGSCSSDEVNTPEDIESNEDDTDDIDDSETDDTDEDETSSLAERFVFNENLVIENSWNTGGCASPPCDTNEDNLANTFVNSVPDEPYFFYNEEDLELKLVSQQERGRRIEFKQRSEGPLSSFSKIEFEAKYYDITDGGITIAQVHNRGGSGNKPFFRLELHNDKLETVIRKDPEVSSSDTTFDKVDYSFVDGAGYDQSTLKVILEKSDGFIRITVEQNEVIILNESFQPDTSTRWVTDTGIANSYYLKAGIYNAADEHTKELVAGYTKVSFESNDE